MTNKIVAMSGAALILCALAALTSASMPDADAVPENIKSLFGQRCAGCHQGRNPSGNLNLEPANVHAVLGAASRQVPSLRIIDMTEPGASYMLKKVRREKDIKGRPMPPGKALADEEMQALAAWIMSLK